MGTFWIWLIGALIVYIITIALTFEEHDEGAFGIGTGIVFIWTLGFLPGCMTGCSNSEGLKVQYHTEQTETVEQVRKEIKGATKVDTVYIEVDSSNDDENIYDEDVF